MFEKSSLQDTPQCREQWCIFKNKVHVPALVYVNYFDCALQIFMLSSTIEPILRLSGLILA